MDAGVQDRGSRAAAGPVGAEGVNPAGRRDAEGGSGRVPALTEPFMRLIPGGTVMPLDCGCPRETTATGLAAAALALA